MKDTDSNTKKLISNLFMHIASLVVVISVIGCLLETPSIATLICYFYGMWVYKTIHVNKDNTNVHSFFDNNEGNIMRKLIEKIKDKFSRKPLLVIPDVSGSPEQPQDNNGDLVPLVWMIEKLRRRDGGCTMNELVAEAKLNFKGIEQIKHRKGK